MLAKILQKRQLESRGCCFPIAVEPLSYRINSLDTVYWYLQIDHADPLQLCRVPCCPQHVSLDLVDRQIASTKLALPTAARLEQNGIQRRCSLAKMI